MTPPAGVREECARGVAWVEAGEGGDGLKGETVAWARRLARGEDITEDKVRLMRAWLARHVVDKKGEGFSPGEPGYPSPGRVAWACWGGDPAVAWSERIVAALDAAEEGRQMVGVVQRRVAWAEDSGAQTRAPGEPARFVASTAAPARSDASIIDQASWKLASYATNPVVLRDHDYEVENIVGRGVASVEGDRLMLTVRWSPTAAGLECQTLYEGGFLHAVSVGWIPGRIQARNSFPQGHPYYGDRGVVYYDCELLEVSMVAIGDDPTAIAEQGPGSRHVEARSATDVSTIARALATDPAFIAELSAALQLSGGLPSDTAPAPVADLKSPRAGGLSIFRKG